MSNQGVPTNGRQEQRDLAQEVKERLEARDVAGAESLLRGGPPADVAEAIEHLQPEQKARIFEALDGETAGGALSELSLGSVQSLADSSPDAVARAAAQMEPDEVADLLEVLSEEQRRSVLENLPDEDALKAKRLLVHPPDTAGGIMTSEFVLLSEDITAATAIEITQRSRESETISHLFVSDSEGRLLGHLPLHRLVFARPERKLSELMEAEPATVSPEADREEVVRLATRYGLDVLPVVDEGGGLAGVITADDILEAEQDEADEDMYRLAGTAERDPVHATVLRSARLRLPWLLLTLVGGLGIAFMVSRFESVLEVVQIAFFIPLIALMGGNVAIQSSTIVVRGLAEGDLYPGRFIVFIVKQWSVAVLLALSCGGAAGLLAAVLPMASGGTALVVGTAVAIAIMLAGTIGTLIPVAFDRFGLDPAVSAGPFVTVLNDLLCIMIYLALSTTLG